MYPKPVQTPHPPIHVGGESNAALRRVARHGQGWYSLQPQARGPRRAAGPPRRPARRRGPQPGADITLTVCPYFQPRRRGDHRGLPARRASTAWSCSASRSTVDMLQSQLDDPRHHRPRTRSRLTRPASLPLPLGPVVTWSGDRPEARRLPWSRTLPLTDGVVTIRAMRHGDAAQLIDGRDAQFHRFFGEGSRDPRPTAVIEVNSEIVGWVDYDHDDDRTWLEPHECNVGYNVFPAHRGQGIAQRAVRLLLERIAGTGEFRVATFLIDVENEASLSVATGVGAAEQWRRVEDDGHSTVFLTVSIDGVVGPTP